MLEICQPAISGSGLQNILPEVESQPGENTFRPQWQQVKPQPGGKRRNLPDW